MAVVNERIRQRILEKKKKLDSMRPLPPSLVKRLKEHMMIKFTYNTNAIEGNTLTLHETRLVIEEGITIKGKRITEALEAKNHPIAIEFIENLVSGEKEIDEDAVLELHRLILWTIEEDAGKYRTTSVIIGGASFIPPPSSEIKPKMKELLEWLRKNPDEYSPIELTTIFHHRFVCIHPFIQGNGRTARLLMNAILMKNGYPFITIVEKQDHPKYLNSLMKADSGNISPFVTFTYQCVERSLDMYIDALEEPEVISLSKASTITPYSQEYLSLLSRKGSLAASKRGRNWVITKTELNRYLKSVGKPILYSSC